MKYLHHDLEFEIDHRWLVEAGVIDFTPTRDCYRFEARGGIFCVQVQSVEPAKERAQSAGIFCDDKTSGRSAKERVVSILQGLRDDCELPPVKVVKSKLPGYDYKLVEGCHRFHCAHALGFVSVPAILGFDMNDPTA